MSLGLHWVLTPPFTTKRHTGDDSNSQGVHIVALIPRRKNIYLVVYIFFFFVAVLHLIIFSFVLLQPSLLILNQFVLFLSLFVVIVVVVVIIIRILILTSDPYLEKDWMTWTSSITIWCWTCDLLLVS